MKDDVALRKRSQIAKANRTMFIWIAIASALIGTAAVVSIFLGQKLVYNEKVLSAKLDTATTLDTNLEVIDGLKTEIRALDANEALNSVKANIEDETLQVVLDALPADANSLALGASLQSKLLANITGSYSLKGLQVTPVVGIEQNNGDDAVIDPTADISTATGAARIAFSFSVEGDQAALRQVLTNLERSIRTITTSNINIEMRGASLVMSVEGFAFYQPSRTLTLTEEVVKVSE